MTNTRPTAVSKAVQLLWMQMGFGIINSLLPMPNAPLPKTSVAFVATVSILTLCFTAFLIDRIGRRHNWARFTYAVLTVLDLPSVAIMLQQLLKLPPLTLAVMSTQLIMQVYAMILLFGREANQWYAAGDGESETD